MPKAKMKRKGAPASAIADLASSGLPVRFRNKTKITGQTKQTNKKGGAAAL